MRLTLHGLRYCPEAFTNRCRQLLRLLWPFGVLFHQDSEPGTASPGCIHGLSEVLSNSLRTPYAPWTAGIILKQKLYIVCFHMPYCRLCAGPELVFCVKGMASSGMKAGAHLTDPVSVSNAMKGHGSCPNRGQGAFPDLASCDASATGETSATRECLIRHRLPYPRAAESCRTSAWGVRGSCHPGKAESSVSKAGQALALTRQSAICAAAAKSASGVGEDVVA